MLTCSKAGRLGLIVLWPVSPPSWKTPSTVPESAGPEIMHGVDPESSANLLSGVSRLPKAPPPALLSEQGETPYIEEAPLHGVRATGERLRLADN